MARESFVDFASSTLATPATMQVTDVSFTVAAGQGSAFPAQSFLVTIDTEILLIATRSGDVFTIASNGRGYDGSIASSHTAGAIVQHSITSYNMNHLWQNVSDTFLPDVPPAQNSLSTTGVPNGAPSVYDTEFESIGNWTLYPSVGSSGSTFNIHTDYRSHLFFNRGHNDNTLYFAYLPFSESGVFIWTCKVSDGISLPQNGNQTTETNFFLCDQSNPTSSHDGGNRIRIDVITNAIVGSGNLVSNNRYVRVTHDINGSFTVVGALLQIANNAPVYLRIYYNGGGTWRLYAGDGFTYTLLTSISNVTLNLQTVGFSFYSGNSSSNFVQHMSVIDFCRYGLVAGQHFPT